MRTRSDPTPFDSPNPQLQREAEFQELLLRNMSTLVTEKTKPVYEQIRSMPCDQVMGMLAEIVKIMPIEHVRNYLTNELKLNAADCETIMTHVSDVYTGLSGTATQASWLYFLAFCHQ